MRLACTPVKMTFDAGLPCPSLNGATATIEPAGFWSRLRAASCCRGHVRVQVCATETRVVGPAWSGWGSAPGMPPNVSSAGVNAP